MRKATLSERRDELAHSRALSLKQKYNDHALDVYTNAKRSYIKGFDACLNELKPEIDALVKALEFYAHNIEYNTFAEKQRALNALTKFKEFMGDE